MFIALILTTQGLVPPSQAPKAAPQPKPLSQEKTMTTRIHGPFDVKLTPLPPGDPTGPWAPGRRSIDKQFHGELEATSQGEMMAAGTAVPGSAGYVAIERVSGTLRGRKGTFLLQHSGTMGGGASQLAITVIPDSGTEALTGLKGTMGITITDGKHAYDFEYTLPDGK